MTMTFRPDTFKPANGEKVYFPLDYIKPNLYNYKCTLLVNVQRNFIIFNILSYYFNLKKLGILKKLDATLFHAIKF